MNHAGVSIRRLGLVLATWAFASPAGAAVVTPGNLLVANGGRVYEYTPAGGFVQAVTGDLRNGVFAESRGLAYDALGRVHVLIRPHDGDVDMFLTTVTPATGAVGYRSLAFHNHNGNTTYGDMGPTGRTCTPRTRCSAGRLKAWSGTRWAAGRPTGCLRRWTRPTSRSAGTGCCTCSGRTGSCRS